MSERRLLAIHDRYQIDLMHSSDPAPAWLLAAATVGARRAGSDSARFARSFSGVELIHAA